MTRLGQHYPWASPDYILHKMTWAQVWLYYEACYLHRADKEYETEIDEPPPLEGPGVIRRADGARVYSR